MTEKLKDLNAKHNATKHRRILKGRSKYDFYIKSKYFFQNVHCGQKPYLRGGDSKLGKIFAINELLYLIKSSYKLVFF